MPTFSIDDVRETFTVDVSSFLGKIDEGARRLLGSPVLAALPAEPDLSSEPLVDGRPTFELISEFGHAIVGTTSLVGADSLTDSARVLEELALRGHEAFVDLDRCAARARRTAEQCLEGARRMRTMLELELARKPSEAVWESLDWVESVTGRGGEPKTVGAARGAAKVDASGAASVADGSEASEATVLASGSDELAPAEFSFEDEPPAPAMSAELREIFDEEARAAVQAMQIELTALAADPTSLATAGNLERLFHTMKGAAATVGLNEISDIAAALQERMEGIVESGTPVAADFAEELLGDVNEMLRAARLPPIRLASEAPTATAAAREAHAFFLEELRTALPDASRTIPSLSSEDAEAARAARTELGRLFHRIKGSALIVGETSIGEESERLQLLMEGEGTTAVAAVAETEVWLALVRARLGGTAATAGERPAETAPIRHAVKMVVNPELGEAFLQECSELMEAIDRELLAIEDSDQPKQSLEALMRHMHTMKGVLNTVGLGPTGEMLHRVEDLLETLMAAAILPPMRAVATLLFDVQGEIRKHLRQAKDGYVEMDLGRLEARIARLLGKPRSPGEEPTGASLAGLTVGGNTGGHGSTGAAASIHSIHSAHSVHSVLGARSDQPRSQPTSSQDDGVGRRYIRVATDRLDALMNLAGELVVSRSRLLSRVGTLKAVQQELSFGHRRLVEAVEEFNDEHEFGTVASTGTARTRVPAKRAPDARLSPQLGGAATEAHRAPEDAGSAGWESFGELELDSYEDINILSRRLTEMTSDFSEMNLQLARNLAAFNDDSEVFGRIVSGIQSEVTRARMVPLDQLFTRLRLPVRDAATREGKEMRVVVEGADVHIDKTIADALFQPMLHLVRNAAVHGIESASTRERGGKQVMGTITLRARQESGQIVIEVADDGAGLDLERLRARGVAMGLVAADVPLSDPTVRDLVFAAGLSTRERAGAVSGRGVGCDVVRRSVERMNGTIRVDSTPARGTVFIVTLPITLAIARALIVRHGDRTYAIPMHFAERIVDAQEESLVQSAGVSRIRIDENFLSVRGLEHYFQSGASTQSSGPILVLRVGTARTVLQVDAVLGQEEIVVKSLGDVLAGHPVFAGVTVRGSGEMSLIVDVPALLQGRAQAAGRQVSANAGVTRARARRAPSKPEPAPEMPASGTATSSASGAASGSMSVAPSGPVADVPTSGGVSAPEQPARPLRVLFIDDSLSVRKFAQITLTELGADVTVAVDGVDGFAKIREGDFDLVFTDLEMPRMHGFELIRQVRFLPAYRDLPIAVVTSRSGSKHQQEARALGATDYLTKPFTAQNLDVVLKRWGQRGSARPSADGRSDSARDSRSVTGDSAGTAPGSRSGGGKPS